MQLEEVLGPLPSHLTATVRPPPPCLPTRPPADIAAVALDLGVDGLIVSNTTITRPGDIAGHEHGGEARVCVYVWEVGCLLVCGWSLMLRMVWKRWTRGWEGCVLTRAAALRLIGLPLFPPTSSTPTYPCRRAA